MIQGLRCGDVLWEWAAPHGGAWGSRADAMARTGAVRDAGAVVAPGGAVVGKPHTPGTHGGGVMEAVSDRVRRHEFKQPRGTAIQVGLQPTEGLQRVVEARGEAQTSVAEARAEGRLQMTEQTTGSRERQGHGSEFPQETVPAV